MTPAERLAKAFELTKMSRELFRQGLRKRFPEADEEELRRIELEKLYGWRGPTSTDRIGECLIDLNAGEKVDDWQE